MIITMFTPLEIIVAPLGLEGSAWELVNLRGVTSGLGDSGEGVWDDNSAGDYGDTYTAVVAQTQSVLFSCPS